MADRITKEDVFNAVLETSFYKSSGATSLADIAGKLGIKKASLYNHFESREDLFSQALTTCENYLKEINFIPNEIEAIAKKYSAETVLKGIVNRYFKMHEKMPLFQIYTFVESQKYFSEKAAQIIKDEKDKLVDQTERVFASLIAFNKISVAKEKVNSFAVWFCSGVNDLLSNYLAKRKQVVIKNPEAGADKLFTLPPDEETLKQMDVYICHFADLVKP